MPCYFHNGQIVSANSREEANKILASSAKGIRLYVLLQDEDIYLISFYCGEAKKLRKLKFEIDDYYYVKPENNLAKYSMDCDSKKLKLLKRFISPNAVQRLKEYVTAETDEDEEDYWYAVIENQGMLVGTESHKGFYKIPKKPLYREVSSIASVRNIVKRIQKAGLKIANLDYLNQVCKFLFGSSVTDESKSKEPTLEKAKEYKIEYTRRFLEEQFKLFNDRYFNNKLPNIPVEWRKTKRYGACYPKYTTNGVSVTKIAVSPTIKEYKEFRDTLVHEMCHALVDISITSEDFNFAKQTYGFNSTKFRRYLGLTDDTCHSGKWAELVESLNKRFPSELHLKRLGSANYKDRDEETGNIKKEAIDKVKTHHILVRENLGKKTLFITSAGLYKQITDNIKIGNTNGFPYNGKWTEYSFKPELLAEFTTDCNENIGRCYKYKCLTVLKRMGALTGSKIISNNAVQRVEVPTYQVKNKRGDVFWEGFDFSKAERIANAYNKQEPWAGWKAVKK